MSTIAKASSTTTNLQWPKGLPGWEKTQLEKLSATGKLSGLPAQLIAAITMAEEGSLASTGVTSAGSARSSTGAGGFFGESTQNYGTGWQLTTAQLSGTTANAFDMQAELAARQFAKYLSETGGTVTKAEGIYQTGKPTKDASLTGWLGGLTAVGGLFGITPGGPTPAGWGPGGLMPTTTTSPENIAKGLGTIARFFAKLGSELSSGFGVGWASVGSIILGAVLILIGLSLLGVDILGMGNIAKGLAV